MRFSLKLSTALIVATAISTGLGVGALVGAYQKDRVEGVQEAERTSVQFLGVRIQNLVHSIEGLSMTSVESSGEVLSISEGRCTGGKFELLSVVLSKKFSALIEDFRSEVDRSVYQKVGEEACAGDLATTRAFFDARPILPFPTLGVWARDGERLRVGLVVLDRYASSASSTLMLVNAKGEFLWTSDGPEFAERALVDTSLNRAQLGALVKPAALAPVAFIHELSPTALGISVPVFPGVALVSLAYRPAILYPVQLQLYRILPLFLGVISLCALFGILFGSSLMRPIQELLNKSESVAEGRFDEPFKETGRDEFGVLRRAFNQMMEKIQALLVQTRDQAVMEGELKLAKHVQQLLIPNENVRLLGYELASSFETATFCGGDFWGYLEIPREGHRPALVLFIGDVEGHGVAPALVTAGTRGAVAVLDRWLRTDPSLLKDPQRINDCLNQSVYACTQGQLFMTFCTAILDSEEQTVTVSNAGHCRPFVISRPSAGGAVQAQAVSRPGVPFGSSQLHAESPIEVYPFPTGSILLFYSDGLIETRGEQGGEFKRKHLRRLLPKLPLQTARGFLDQLLRARKGALQGPPAKDDDVTVVVCRSFSDETYAIRHPEASS